tara:strand:- start:93 stop:1094 length:1002 start_codon:yes stop_codon:yes gene_type:complete
MLNDIQNFIKLLKFQKKIKRIYFIENKKYLGVFLPYINNSKKKDILILTFSELSLPKNINLHIINLKTNFFRKLFFMTTDAKFIYSSTPDLGNSLFVRSKNPTSRYLYLQHSPVGLLKAYKEKSFLNFDMVFCNSTYQKEDINIINKYFKKRIKTWKQKIILNNHKKKNLRKNLQPSILIAPSWSTNFYSNEILKAVENCSKDFKITFRPHYMSFKKKEISEKYFVDKNIELDQNDKCDFKKFDLIISDWSGIYIEYILSELKKPLLINLPEKKRNNFFSNNLSIEKKLRKDFSTQLNLENIGTLKFIIKTILNKDNSISDEHYNRLKEVFYL